MTHSSVHCKTNLVLFVKNANVSSPEHLGVQDKTLFKAFIWRTYMPNIWSPFLLQFNMIVYFELFLIAEIELFVDRPIKLNVSTTKIQQVLDFAAHLAPCMERISEITMMFTGQQTGSKILLLVLS